MAQFVTHIQPTLVEASHHHPPHYYHHHHKDCHQKDCKHHDHHKEEHQHKDGHHKECTIKDCHSKDCQKDHHKDAYHKECTVKDCHLKECGHHKKDHHDKESLKSPPLSDGSYPQSRKGSQGHFYIDSHGVKHEYDIHFVDEQGIYRQSEVRSHPENDENQKESEIKSLHSKSEHEIIKPTPPQFIDIQPVHVENKLVSTFIHVLLLRNGLTLVDTKRKKLFMYVYVTAKV